jgi:4-amino-4-deoxy-L-arabinose transferase-like glycosyltransferase
MQNLNSPSRFLVPLWLVWAVALGTVLIGLGSYGLLNNNEGLYAEIPREMIASHAWRSWVIPHLNGLPYMEKPPLLYWLTALSFLLFGVSEWSARLVPAVSSLACVALLVWFGKSIHRPQAGRLAALMFVTGFGVFAMSRVLMFDMLLTALLAAALMFSYHYAEQARLRWLLWAYAFLGLAVLAKGFVALILFGLVITAFEISRARGVREFIRNCGRWLDLRALGMFVLVAAPWHVAASLTEPAFAWFYFINEHVLRFLGRREPHDYYAGAWWYYLPRMVIYLFPWSLLLPLVIVGSKKGQKQKNGLRPDASFALPSSNLAGLETNAAPFAPDLQRFLLVAWLLPLAFFSISSAKANYYLVTVMPFAALHLAILVEARGLPQSRLRALPGILIGACATAGYAVFVLRPPSASGITFLGLSEGEFISGALLALALLAIACALLAWRSVKAGILSYLALPIFSMALLAVAIVPLEPQISARPLAQYLQQTQAGRQVYLYRNFEELSSLPFYLKQTVPVIDSKSADLFWGDRLRPGNRSIVSSAQFAEKLSQQPVAVVVMNRELPRFRDTGYFDRFSAQHQIGNTTVFFN